MQLSTRHQIVQQLMLDQVICIRKAAIDQLRDGIKSLGFIKLIRRLPKIFEELFIARSTNSSETTPELLLHMFHANCSSGKDHHSFKLFKDYIASLDKEGNFKTYIFMVFNKLYFICRLQEPTPVLHWRKINTANWIFEQIYICLFWRIPSNPGVHLFSYFKNPVF